MQEIQARSPGQDNHLEEEIATHSSILAWEIPWTESWTKRKPSAEELMHLNCSVGEDS